MKAWRTDYLKKLFIMIGTFAAAIIFLWLLLFLTAWIPNEKIRDNMEKSALSYKNKDAYQFTNGEKFNAIEDNYADAILLGVAWNIGNGSPLQASLDTKYYDGGAYGESFGLYASVVGKAVPNTDYSRYWHGFAAVIRPLMLVMDVEGVELTGFLVIMVLLVVVCAILIKKGAGFAATGLVVSLSCVQIWNVRMSLEYMPVFMITLLMCLVFLLTEEKGETWLVALSVVTGTMAAFFDFLTTETVTILLPLMLVLMLRNQKGRMGELRENILLVVKCMAAWGMSYCMTFLVKWCAVSIVTQENKFALALSSAGRRVHTSEAEENTTALQQFLYAIPANLSTIFGGEERVDAARIFVGFLAVLLVAGSIFYLFRTKCDSRGITWLLLILGVMPYVRYLVLSNHSYLHEFFTYRAQCVSVLALWGCIWFHIRLPHLIRRRYKKKNRR